MLLQACLLEAFIGQSFLSLLLFSLLEVDSIQAFPLANLAQAKEKGRKYFSVSLVKVDVQHMWLVRYHFPVTRSQAPVSEDFIPCFPHD